MADMWVMIEITVITTDVCLSERICRGWELQRQKLNDTPLQQVKLVFTNCRSCNCKKVINYKLIIWRQFAPWSTLQRCLWCVSSVLSAGDGVIMMWKIHQMLSEFACRGEVIVLPCVCASKPVVSRFLLPVKIVELDSHRVSFMRLVT